MEDNKYEHNEKVDITFKCNVSILKIYFNEILHLFLEVEKLKCIRSWYINKNDLRIELVISDISYILEYNSEYKWKEVLRILDKNVT